MEGRYEICCYDGIESYVYARLCNDDGWDVKKWSKGIHDWLWESICLLQDEDKRMV